MSEAGIARGREASPAVQGFSACEERLGLAASGGGINDKHKSVVMEIVVVAVLVLLLLLLLVISVVIN
jgi:hypothetical protein